MATDDVHDLFGREADESGDEAGESGARPDESDGPAGEVERPPRGDEESVEPADPVRDGTAGSPTSSGEDGESSTDDPESAVTTGDVDAFFDDDPAEGSDRPAADTEERSDESGRSGAGIEHPSLDDGGSMDPADPAPEGTTGSPSTSADEAAGDDLAEFEPAASPSRGEVDQEDAADPGPAEPATSSSGGPTDDDRGEPASGEATIFSEDVPAEERDGDPDGTGETAESTSTDDRDTSEPGGATASEDGTTPNDRGASASGGKTTATNGPTADDGFVTASPTEPDGPAVDEEAAVSALSKSGRLSTGVDVLDESMGGGVPPGRLVVLVADPGVQSELIVDSVLTQRDTLFVTTDRPDWEVQKDIEPGLGSGEITVQEHTPDSLLSGVDSLLDEIGTTSNFVLDSVNELELVSRGRYRIFLSDVKRRLFETGSVGLLTGVTVDHDSARDLTLRRADIVWRIETRTAGGELEHWLSVPKFRGGAAMTETVKLQLTDEVRVDPGWREE